MPPLSPSHQKSPYSGFFQRLTKLFRSGPSIRRKVKGYDYRNIYDREVAMANQGWRGIAPFGKDTLGLNSIMGQGGMVDRHARYQEFVEAEHVPEVACLSGDTKVYTLQGPRTLKCLTDSWDLNPEPFQVWAWDHERSHYTAATAHHPRKTGTRKVVEILLDNGKTLVCTPEHKILLKDGTYKAANELVPNEDALMPFRHKISSQGYLEVSDGRDFGGYKPAHRYLLERVLGQDLTGLQVHHKNKRKFDNSFDNLEAINGFEHARIHGQDPEKRIASSKTLSQRWKEASPEQRESFQKGLRAWQKTPEAREFMIEHGRLVAAANWSNPDFVQRMAMCAPASSERMKKLWEDPTWKAWKSNLAREVLKRKLAHDRFAFANYGDQNGRFQSLITNEQIMVLASQSSSLAECSRRLFASYPNLDSPKDIRHKMQFVRRRLQTLGYKTFKDFKREWKYSNHKVKGVTLLPGVVDVYDLTVDFHQNFCLDSGIIVSNSALSVFADEAVASDENGKCFHIYSDNPEVRAALDELFNDVMNVEYNLRFWVRNLPVKWDTLIPLLDGTETTIKDLSGRVQTGEEVWVYSVQDGTNNLVPGKVIWCDRTKISTPIVRVWLDNGTFVDTDPEHPFVCRSGRTIEASRLTPGQSLMPFYTKVSTKTDSICGYEKVYNPHTNHYKFTHRVVSEAVCPDPENLLEGGRVHTHHKNFNKRNNHPSNLVRMTRENHLSLHYEIAKNNLQRSDIVEKRMAGIDRWLKSDRRRAMLSAKMAGFYHPAFKEYNNSPEHATHNSVRSLAMKQHWSDPSRRAQCLRKMTLKWDEKCIKRVQQTLKACGDYVGMGVLGKILASDQEFLQMFADANPGSKRNLQRTLNGTTITTLLRRAGFNDYAHFVRVTLPETESNFEFRRMTLRVASRKQQKNHKVVRVEYLDAPADVYCMTVVGPNGERDRHNFAVCSKQTDGTHTRNGVFVANCKFGDFCLLNEVAPDHGIINVAPVPVTQIEREEGFDHNDPWAVRFRWQAGASRYLENWQVAHFRLLGSDQFYPYGQSVLDPARRIIRMLVMAEDAMLAYRIIRASERRVFYIDTAGIPPNDIPTYMARAQASLRSSVVSDRSTGRADYRHSPISLSDDLFIPTRGNNFTTKVETLPGGQNTSATEDVEYLQNKLFSALQVPKAFLGYSEDLASKASLAQLDVRFSRTISVVQKVVIAELNKLAMIHLYAKGFDGEDLVDFDLRLSNPSTIAMQQKLELWAAKFNIAGVAKEVSITDEEWIQKNILGLSNDEIGRMLNGRRRDKAFASELESITPPQSPPEAPEPIRTDLFAPSAYEVPGSKGSTNDTPDDPQQSPQAGPEGGEVDLSSVESRSSDPPIKPSGFLARHKKNTSRQRPHGRYAQAAPDFSAMLTPSKNVRMRDTYDQEFLKTQFRSEAAELERIDKLLFPEPSPTAPKITGEILCIFRRFDRASGRKRSSGVISEKLNALDSIQVVRESSSSSESEEIWLEGEEIPALTEDERLSQNLQEILKPDSSDGIDLLENLLAPTPSSEDST